MQLISGNVEQVEYFENNVLTKSGDERIIAWHNTFIKNEKGSVISTISSGDDITERKKAEEERAKLLYDLGERIKELNCLYALSRIREKPGITLEGIFKELVKLIPPSWQYPEITCARLIFEKREIKTDNFKGTKWKLSADVQVYKEKVGVLEVFYLEEKPESYEGPFLREERDLLEAVAERLGRIIESKKNEDELKILKNELERSNTDLQQFAYAASHDLQAPIRNVEGFAKLLAKRYDDKLDNKARELIRFIIEGVKNMQNLITDLLEYSQVESKGRAFKVFDISNPLALAIANLENDIEENDVEITYDDLPKVMGDSAQLTRLFQNLLENAIKFRGKQRPKVHISVKPGENEWVFSVSDNGIGIDTKDTERIFSVFHQLHGKSEYPGTGIGLALCKKIVERHSGRIWVESEPGKGSTFYFTMQFMKEKI
jgi:signal transduction histidine kinase